MSVKAIKIAVVDDDQIYQFILQRTLAKIQTETKVINLSNCQEMFNFLKRNADNEDLLPDIILLDLNTPFMHGWEFLDAYDSIKNSLVKYVAIYLISSSVNPFDKEKAAGEPNLSGFFSKPIEPEQLQEIVQEAFIRQL